MTGINKYGAYGAQNVQKSNTGAVKADAAANANKAADAAKAGGVHNALQAAKLYGKSKEYGKTVGEPELSDKAKKCYDDLKKKFGNYDFILVSKDEKENAKANMAKYANGFKTVVLIDEEKLEKMANDDAYRKQIEGALSGATSQLEQLKKSMSESGANVKGYGIQINDDGTTKLFAVLKKSSSDQKARIEKNAAKKKAEHKEEAKRAAKKENEERLKESRLKNKETDESKAENDVPDWGRKIKTDEETVTVSADSVEELMGKINDFYFGERSDSVLTSEEMMLGGNIDFKG